MFQIRLFHLSDHMYVGRQNENDIIWTVRRLKLFAVCLERKHLHNWLKTSCSTEDHLSAFNTHTLTLTLTHTHITHNTYSTYVFGLHILHRLDHILNNTAPRCLITLINWKKIQLESINSNVLLNVVLGFFSLNCYFLYLRNT